MIRTLPWRARNRLAETVLRALRDPEARRELRDLAGSEGAAWLAPEDRPHAPLARQRAQGAVAALEGCPLLPVEASFTEVLDAAGRLFDAGLAFEVHELLEPYWARAAGERREVLQGLIQIAVGYQHLANGNRTGARALLDEGSRRLEDRRLDELDPGPFARAVRDSLARLTEPEGPDAPRFPRPIRGQHHEIGGR